MDEGVRILELARNAQALFERQPAREKRRLLNFLLSNCTWEDGEVVAIFRQPFDLLAETNTAVARLNAGNGGNSSKNEIWLVTVPTNRAGPHGRKWRTCRIAQKFVVLAHGTTGAPVSSTAWRNG